MTKKQYLQLLKQYIGTLSPAEVEEISSEIAERFTLAKEKGETVAQVIAKLGTPEFLAQSYLKTQDQNLSAPSWSGAMLFRLILVLILNFFFLGWFWFTLFVLLGAAFIATSAFIFSGLMVVLAPLLETVFYQETQLALLPLPLYWSFGATLFFTGLFVFLLLLSLSKSLVSLFWHYLKFNFNWIKKV